MAQIHIRPYVETDLDALIALFRESVRGIASRDYTPEQIEAWAPDDIDRATYGRRQIGRQTWIAALDGTMAGYADLEPDGHLDNLYVHPDHQRRGVASALLAQIEASAAARGIARLHSEASITALPFFEARGFKLIAPQTVTFNGQRFINFRMEKHLAAL